MSERNEQDHAAALLAMDYDHFADSYWKSEQMGETRVNWLIGVVTGGVGGLAYFAQSVGDSLGLRVGAVATLTVLALFGLVTLWRIFKRNAASTAFIRSLHTIRGTYRDRLDPGGVLKDYRPIRPVKVREFGGLAHLVGTIVALLAGAAVFAAAYPIGDKESMPRALVAAAASILAAAAVFSLLLRSIKRSESRIGAEQASEGSPERAS